MSDKRTYKNYKEFGEDMSYESEVKYDMEDKNLKLSMQQSLANKFERFYKDEKNKRQQAENELAVIKATGINSNEMKELKQQIEDLKKEQDIKNDQHTIEILQKDKDLEIKDKEIGRLMAKVNNGR
jgi:nucleosome binding factor SPN SPT16 subunit